MPFQQYAFLKLNFNCLGRWTTNQRSALRLDERVLDDARTDKTLKSKYADRKCVTCLLFIWLSCDTPLTLRNGKLVDNFSPESDVTSLQDPVTSRPYLDTSLLDFDLLETFFRRPSSRVLFFGRLQYRSFLDDSNTYDLRETSVTTFTFFFVGLFLSRPYNRFQI